MDSRSTYWKESTDESILLYEKPLITQGYSVCSSFCCVALGLVMRHPGYGMQCRNQWWEKLERMRRWGLAGDCGEVKASILYNGNEQPY
jgi:hypothetical protein